MKTVNELCRDLQLLCQRLKRETRPNVIASLMGDFNENVNVLKAASEVDGRNARLIQPLQIPLLALLIWLVRTYTNSDLKCTIIKSMSSVLDLTGIHNLDLFFDVYTVIFSQIFDTESHGLNMDMSEEMELEVVKCAAQLVINSSKELLQALYDQKHASKLSLGVLMAVQIAQDKKHHDLRLKSLQFLLALSQHNDNIHQDLELHKKVGDVFMLFLPGTVAPLQNIILRDETQPHLITTTALSCWGHILSIVMCDQQMQDDVSDETLVKTWLAQSRSYASEPVTLNVNKALKSHQRDKDWLEAAALTLKPLIHKLPNIRKHNHPKVRLELIKVVTSLLEHCIKNFKASLTPIIEILVSFTEDEDESVRNSAQLSVSSLEAKCHVGHKKLFIEVIEENLYILVNKLPGIIYAEEERLTLSSFQLLSGYLKILGSSKKLITFNLQKLVSVLMMASELTLYPEISEQEFSIWDEGEISSIRSWKRFKHFADKSTVKKFEEICQLLSSCWDSEIFIDHLTDHYIKNPNARQQSLLVMNEVISGSSVVNENVVKHILEVYLEPENLYLPLEVDDIECCTLKEARCNILKVALLMEGIGKLSVVMGKRMEQHLLRSLYFVIERIGSSYTIIRTAAIAAAMQISQACELDGTVSSLIQSNIDYLTYHLTMKLKRISSNSCVFDVVIVIMKNSPMEAMPNLEEILNNVLKNSAERFESPYTISYLRLFQTFVLCVSKWVATGKKKSKNSAKIEVENEVESLVQYIENKIKKHEEDCENDSSEEVAEEKMEAETVEEKEKLPVHVRMTLSIARHCLNYLPSRDRDKKIMVLEILNSSVLILSSYENELLPLVHEIWSPLVTRFERVTDPLIISRSFSLLCTLSDVSYDFIRSRTLKEVLPTLRLFLLKTAEKSKKKDSGSGYYFTQEYKLQRELLDKLGKLATDLRLFEKQTDCIIECSLPYLSSLQPKPLQDGCRKLILHIQEYDPYLVWVRLKPLLSDQEFSGNAQKLLLAYLPTIPSAT